ncbi:MAG: Rid family hydrolase [Pseudomonadota bacterium]
MVKVTNQSLSATQSVSRELAGGLVRFSGIVPRDVSGDIHAQTRNALAIVDERLSELGVDRTSVLMVHIWLSSMALFQGMTAEWNNWVGDLAPPSRSCVSGTPVVPGALLELEVVALLPDAQARPDEIKRYGLVKGSGRPTMCLALRSGGWFTVCTLASDTSQGIAGQTRQVLTVFDNLMKEAGVARTASCKLEIWLRDIADFDAVNDVLGGWFAPDPVPAATVVGANMAGPDMLIEIRLTAMTER